MNQDLNVMVILGALLEVDGFLDYVKELKGGIALYLYQYQIGLRLH